MPFEKQGDSVTPVVDGFVRSYIETALWCSQDMNSEDENDDSSLESLGYDADDLSPEALAEIVEQCDAFRESASEMGYDADTEQHAHDFFLTRNRHGAGFWDGDYPEQEGKDMTELSHPYGDQLFYVDADGLIYIL